MARSKLFLSFNDCCANKPLPGYEITLPEDIKAVLTKYDLTFKMSHQQCPFHMNSSLFLAGNHELIPVYDEHLRVPADIFGATEKESVANIKKLVESRLQARGELGEGIRRSLAVYAYESFGRTAYTVYPDTAMSNKRKVVGIIYTFSSLYEQGSEYGSFAMTNAAERVLSNIDIYVNQDFITVTLYNDDRLLLQFGSIPKDAILLEKMIKSRLDLISKFKTIRMALYSNNQTQQ